MYSLPAEGEEDNNPVVLRDVEADDFRAFLKCALKTFSDNEGSDVWLSAIKVSDLWHLARVRSFAISKLEQSETELATRMELARTHGIHEWFRPTMLSFALRKKVPVKREAEQIGWENTILLFQLREKLCPLRKRIMQTTMVSAQNVNANSIAFTCPFCRLKIVTWGWVTVTDKVEAQDAKKAILDAFSSDSDEPKKNKRDNGSRVNSQPLRRSPPSSIRGAATYAGLGAGVATTAATSSGCCDDCCGCGDCLGCCFSCCTDVCCCCC